MEAALFLNDESNSFLLSLIGGLWAVAPPMAPPKRREREEKELIDSWKEKEMERERNKAIQLERPFHSAWMEGSGLDWLCGVAHQGGSRGKSINSFIFCWPAVRHQKDELSWMEEFGWLSLYLLMGYGLRPSNAKEFHSSWLLRHLPFHLSCSFFFSCSFHSHSQPLKIDLLKKEIIDGMEEMWLELEWAVGQATHNLLCRNLKKF